MLDMFDKKNEDLIILKSIRETYNNPSTCIKKYLKRSKNIMVIVFISAFIIGFINNGVSVNPTLMLAIGAVTGLLIGLSVYYKVVCKNIDIINKYDIYNKDIIEKHINEKET